MSILHIKALNYHNGNKQLYQDASIRVNKGEHIALIGPNGSGKTTLLNIIIGEIKADKIDLTLFPYIKIGYLDQHQEVDNEITIYDYLKEAYQDLIAQEKEMNQLYDQLGINYDEAVLNKALKLQAMLDHSDFINIDKYISNLVKGLGINSLGLQQKLSSISGGQKSKILLAKLLLSKNDFLLLDEPTNFLDLEQVNWLAGFLQTYPNAFLLISHDRDFINKVANIIYAIENLTITRYVGNFETYLSLNELHQKQYLMEYKSQQKEIVKLKTYVSKNIARKSTSKSARSRQKQLEKMDVLSRPQVITKPKFNFKYRQSLVSTPIKASRLEIGYDKPLTKPLTFKIKDGDKWLVQGYNGIGKTTLLQTIVGEIKPISGTVTLDSNLAIGYFRQIEKFEQLTPFSYLKTLIPTLDDREIRSILANFAIKKDLAFQNIGMLSGGEQTKVRLAALSLTNYSLLILDEPTNHLDDLAKESLLEAVDKYQGTILLTSHDINFSTAWANKTLNFKDFMIE